MLKTLKVEAFVFDYEDRLERMSQSSKKNASRSIRRNLLAEIRETNVIPEFYVFKATVCHPSGIGSSIVDFHMILPHEWLGHLHRYNSQKFSEYFLGDPGDLEEIICETFLPYLVQNLLSVREGRADP